MFLPFLPVLSGQVSPAPIIWPSHLHSWIYALKFSSEFQTLLSHLIQVGTLEYNFHLLFHKGKLCCSLSFYCFSLGHLSKDLVVWCFLFIFKLVEFLWTRKQKVSMEGFLLNDSLLFCYWTETASSKYGVFQSHVFSDSMDFIWFKRLLFQALSNPSPSLHWQLQKAFLGPSHMLFHSLPGGCPSINFCSANATSHYDVPLLGFFCIPSSHKLYYGFQYRFWVFQLFWLKLQGIGSCRSSLAPGFTEYVLYLFFKSLTLVLIVLENYTMQHTENLRTKVPLCS